MKFNYKNWAVFVLIALFFLHTGYYFTLYHPLNIIDLIVFETPLKNDEKIAFLTLIIALFGGGLGAFFIFKNKKKRTQ